MDVAGPVDRATTSSLGSWDHDRDDDEEVVSR